jgi:hypothetical protein
VVPYNLVERQIECFLLLYFALAHSLDPRTKSNIHIDLHINVEMSMSSALFLEGNKTVLRNDSNVEITL